MGREVPGGGEDEGKDRVAGREDGDGGRWEWWPVV